MELIQRILLQLILIWLKKSKKKQLKNAEAEKLVKDFTFKHPKSFKYIPELDNERNKQTCEFF